MTRRLIHILLLFLCMLLGWVLGYIKVPYIELDDTFWIGIIGCLGIMGFIISLFRIWNVQKAINPDETPQSSLNVSMFKSLINYKFLVAIIIIGLISACLIAYYHTKQLNEELKMTQVALEDFKSNTNVEQQRINISLLLDLIHKLDSKPVNVQDTVEMINMIDRIVSLSSSFKINRVWDIANKVNIDLSEERGLLLLALLKTKMDSIFFNKIKANVSFYGADLRNADLHGLDLSGIDLKYAHLEYANMQGINLNDANLNGANLMGVNLNNATLVGTNLISSKLSWAKVNDADLRFAKLGRADISNSTFLNSNLFNASLIQAVLCNAVLIEANLTKCIMMATILSNANFSKAVFINSYIHSTNLSDAILNDVIIQENWILRINENNNIGVNIMLKNYQIVCDSLSIKDSIIYKLKTNTQ